VTTPSPVIVTGMHRSGTTLLVRLLTQLGAFFGSRLDPNAEDYFFMRLNEWIMRRAGGAWDYPLPTLRFLGTPRFLEDTCRYLEAQVSGPAFASSGGSRGSVDPRGAAWGFKDPRAVFTFAAWNRVFPGAKLLYIRRNGVDAASSLFAREAARWRDDAGADGDVARDTRYLEIRPLMGRFRDALKSTESFEAYLFSTRCLSLEESFRLWEEYVGEGERLFAAHPGPKLDLRYEALIESPEEQLERAARFCGLAPAAERIREVVAPIDRTRAYAFLRDAGARAFYETVRDTPLMRTLGYGGIAAAEPRG